MGVSLRNTGPLEPLPPVYKGHNTIRNCLEQPLTRPIEKGREGLEYAHGNIHHWEFEKEVLERVTKELR